MKTAKKILSILLAVAIIFPTVFSSMGTSVQAADPTVNVSEESSESKEENKPAENNVENPTANNPPTTSSKEPVQDKSNLNNEKSDQVKKEEPSNSNKVTQDTNEKEELQSKEKEDNSQKEEEKDYPAMSLTANAGQVTVTLNAPEGSLPKGSKLTAHQVGNQYISAVKDTLESQGRSLSDAVAIDVTPIDKDGKEVQPKKAVFVTFSGTGLDLNAGDSVAVYRVADDASSVTPVSGGGSANSQSFTTNHFTIYVTGGSATQNPPGTNGNGTNNSQSTRYVLGPGKSVVLKTSHNYDNTNYWYIDAGQSYVSLDKNTHTVTNINTTSQDQSATIRWTRQGSNEYFYITAQADNKKTVNFNLQDAGASNFSVVDTQKVTPGSDATAPQEPDEKTVDGKKYTFSGWCSDEACTIPATLTNIQDNMEVYGKYVLNMYDIAFMFKDVDSADFVQEYISTVASGDDVIDAPTHADKKVEDISYTFIGWFTGEDCTQLATLTNIQKGATVYGKYVLKKHTVTFNLQDVGESAYTEVQKDDVESGNTVTPIEEPEEKQDLDGNTYVFSGWFKDEGCTIPASFDRITEDKDFYAKYILKEYKVTFMFQDADASTFTKEYESTVSSGSDVTDAPVHEDTDTHFFIGWCSNGECTTSADLTNIQSDMTVYGKYVKKVSLSYHPNTTDAVVMPDPNPVVVPEGSKVTLSTAARTGYKLLGWSTTEEGTAENTYDPDAEITINEDTMVYAQWEAEATVTLTYHKNYTTLPEEFAQEEVTANTTVQLIDERPERENYLFSGWAEDANADKPTYVPGAQYDVGVQDADLYAVWYPVPENINLGYETLTAFGNEIVTYDGKEHALEYKTVRDEYGTTAICGVKETDYNPTHGDYKYAGYVRVGNVGDDPSRHHIYAKVDGIVASGTDAGVYSTPIVAQLFTHNSSTNSFEPLKHGPNDEYDAYIAVLNGSLTINPVDVTFSTQGASKYYDGTPLTANGTASFKEYQEDIDQTFTPDGNTVTLVNGELLNVRASGSQTNKGTSINGFEVSWGNPSDAWGGDFPNSTAKQGNYNILTGELGTLEVMMNQVTYDDNAGSDTVTNMPVPNPDDSGATYKVSTTEPEREHYTFNGWSTEAGGSGDAYSPGDDYTFPSEVHSVTFYAQWTIDTHDVIYDPNGGTFDGKTTPTETTEEYGAEISIPEAAQKDNYVFQGWKAGDTTYQPDDDYTVTDNVTFVAQWSPEPRTITIDPNGGVYDGKETPTEVPSSYDAQINVPEAATRDNYIFRGWKAGDTTYQPNDPYTVTDDVTFVAQWKPKPRTITIDPNGGVYDGKETPTEVPTIYDALISVPEAATKDNYIFQGWKAGDTVYQPGDEYTVTDDVTFMAQWKPEPRTITVDPNGGSYNEKETPTEIPTSYDAKINVPEAPTRYNYIFKGWKSGDEIYQPGDEYTVADDVTFTAQWEAKSLVITYDPNGGAFRGTTEKTNIDCHTDDVITIAEAPTREGYTFLYWKGSEYHPGDKYTVKDSHTFVAQWKKNDDKKPKNPSNKAKKTKVKPKIKQKPATGDNLRQISYILLMFLSLCLIIAIVKADRKKNRFIKTNQK